MVDDTNHAPADHLGTVNLTAGLHPFEGIMWEASGGDEVEFYAVAGASPVWTDAMRLVGDTAAGELAAFTAPVGSGSGVIATDIEAAMRNKNATCYVRVPFTAAGPGGFSSL